MDVSERVGGHFAQEDNFCRHVVASVFNPFMPNGLSYIQSSDWSISNIRGVWLILLLPCFIEIPVSNAKSIDPDQTPRSSVSDLDLHCLLMSLLWDAWHKCVKTFQNWRATLTEKKEQNSLH